MLRAKGYDAAAAGPLAVKGAGGASALDAVAVKLERMGMGSPAPLAAAAAPPPSAAAAVPALPLKARATDCAGGCLPRAGRPRGPAFVSIGRTGLSR